MTKYYQPEYRKENYTCPICDIYSSQVWYDIAIFNEDYNIGYDKFPRLKIAVCIHCKEQTLWLDGKMVFPLKGNGPIPSEDMSSDIRKYYDEALKIMSISPRSSAALLRLEKGGGRCLTS